MKRYPNQRNRRKNAFVLFFSTAVVFCCTAQRRDTPVKAWFVTAEMELITPFSANYAYTVPLAQGDNYRITGVGTEKLRTNISMGALGSIQYLIAKSISFGAILGFQSHLKPYLYVLKVGGVLRVYFLKRNIFYGYMSIAENISFRKIAFHSGTNLRFGLGLPFLKRAGYRLNLNLFFEQNSFVLSDARPLLSIPNEQPQSLTFSSLGISIGIRL